MQVALPVWPPYSDAQYPPLEYYRVSIVSGDGEEILNVQNGGYVMVENVKDGVTAVVVQPVTRAGECSAAFFRPAGCVLPAAFAATWEGGYAADVCAALLKKTALSGNGAMRYLAKFNWGRFTNEVALRSIDTKSLAGQGVPVVCDPWTLDAMKVYNNILTAAFTATTITPTTDASNCTVKDVSSLLEKASGKAEESSCTVLLPRYVCAYPLQQSTGKARLMSDRYTAEKNITGSNLFLFGDSLVYFAVAIKGSGAKAESTVNASALSASRAAFLHYGIDTL